MDAIISDHGILSALEALYGHMSNIASLDACRHTAEAGMQFLATWVPHYSDVFSLRHHAESGYPPYDALPTDDRDGRGEAQGPGLTYISRADLNNLGCCDCALCFKPTHDQPNATCHNCLRGHHWGCLTPLKWAGYTAAAPPEPSPNGWLCPACSATTAAQRKEWKDKARSSAPDQAEAAWVVWARKWEPEGLVTAHEDYGAARDAYAAKRAGERQATRPPRDANLTNQERQEGITDAKPAPNPLPPGKLSTIPTEGNPHLDSLHATGRYEWYRSIFQAFVPTPEAKGHQDGPAQPHTESMEVVSLHRPDGASVGTVSRGLASKLWDAFEIANAAGHHQGLTPPARGFLAELAGLLARHPTDAPRLPETILGWCKQHFNTGTDRQATPLTADPSHPRYCSTHERDRLFGAAGSTWGALHSGHSIWATEHTPEANLRAVRHAVASALGTTAPVSTILFLTQRSGSPTWMRWAAAHPELCTRVATIKAHHMAYKTPHPNSRDAAVGTGSTRYAPRNTTILLAQNQAAIEGLATTLDVQAMRQGLVAVCRGLRKPGTQGTDGVIWHWGLVGRLTDQRATACTQTTPKLAALRREPEWRPPSPHTTAPTPPAAPPCTPLELRHAEGSTAWGDGSKQEDKTTGSAIMGAAFHVRDP